MRRTLRRTYKYVLNAQGYKEKHGYNTEKNRRYKTEVNGASRGKIYNTQEETFTGRDYTDQMLQQKRTGNWKKANESIQAKHKKEKND